MVTLLDLTRVRLVLCAGFKHYMLSYPVYSMSNSTLCKLLKAIELVGGGGGGWFKIFYVPDTANAGMSSEFIFQHLIQPQQAFSRKDYDNALE